MKSIFVNSRVVFIFSNPAIDFAVFEKPKKNLLYFFDTVRMLLGAVNCFRKYLKRIVIFIL